MSNIDFDFILKQEGFETKGYVPDAENSKSGVTIASGFDLGARKLSDLKGLPQDIIDLLSPFLGFQGAEASEIAPNLVVSEDQAKIINEFAKSEAITNLKTKWENATGTSFDDLGTEQATVLASVAFQYGDLESRTPNFWKQTTSGDWVGAYKNLLKFGDRYTSRRLDEAALLWSSDALKKSISDGTSTGILSNEAQDAMTNVLESDPEYKDIANTVLNTKGTPIEEVVNNTIDTVGNFVEGVREYNTQAEEQAAQIPELIEGYKEIDKETEAMGQKFETDSAKDFINNIEPPQLWNLDYATPYDKEDFHSQFESWPWFARFLSRSACCGTIYRSADRPAANLGSRQNQTGRCLWSPGFQSHAFDQALQNAFFLINMFDTQLVASDEHKWVYLMKILLHCHKLLILTATNQT